MKPENNRGWLILIVFVGAVWLSLFLNRPPSPAAEDAPETSFSAARAERHLQEIAQVPHPTGSVAHAKVATYLEQELANLGLAVETQDGIGLYPTGWGSIFGSVHNIVGRIKGSDGKRAIMLMAHYDSVYTSPGAGDDGAAVAALLETARALTKGPQPFHDIIFLFTDNEEGGTLGAQYFAANYPRLKELLYVFNFEARGNGGPSLMFETSANNAGMLTGFHKAVPHPFANSLASAIYGRMNNDTDFTQLKGLPIQGMNFAFIGGVTHYHGMLDSLEHLNRGSVQHQGSYALGLAQYFGNLSEPPVSGGDAVYFNLLGSMMVRYGAGMVWPLSLLVLLAWPLIWFKLRGKELVSPGKTVKGFMAGVLIWLSVPIVAILSWMILSKVHSQYHQMIMHPYNSNTYLLAFCLLGLVLAGTIIRFSAKRLGIWNLALGALILPLVLLLVMSVLLPNGSWVLMWPLLLALATCGLQAWPTTKPALRLVMAFSGVFAIFMITPLAYHVYISFPMGLMGASLAMFAMLIIFLVPQLWAIFEQAGRMLPTALLVVVLGLFIFVATRANFSEERPEPSSIFYGLNMDTGEAVLASINPVLSKTSQQYLGEKPERGSLAQFVLRETPIFHVSVPAVDLEGPVIEQVSQTIEGDTLILELTVHIPREAWGFRMRATAANGIAEVQFNGMPAKTTKQGLYLFYRGETRSSFHFRFVIAKDDSLMINLLDESSSLPKLPGIPESIPATSIPSPFGGLGSSYQYTTHVHRSFTFKAQD